MDLLSSISTRARVQDERRYSLKRFFSTSQRLRAALDDSCAGCVLTSSTANHGQHRRSSDLSAHGSASPRSPCFTSHIASQQLLPEDALVAVPTTTLALLAANWLCFCVSGCSFRVEQLPRRMPSLSTPTVPRLIHHNSCMATSVSPRTIRRPLGIVAPDEQNAPLHQEPVCKTWAERNAEPSPCAVSPRANPWGPLSITQSKHQTVCQPSCKAQPI
jgi:hypothetical protein